MPQRQRYLFVCTNRRADDHPKGSCMARGAEELQQALKSQLKARGLAGLQARACTSSCLDQCTAGPTILVAPDHFFMDASRWPTCRRLSTVLRLVCAWSDW